MICYFDKATFATRWRTILCMGYHPRIESSTLSSFITTRTVQSRLWFVNNPQFEGAALGYAAKFSKRYNVKLYALGIQGNHFHCAGAFPKMNRANFMRDFNSCTAKALSKYTPEFGGGRVWGRRYSAEIMPGAEDVEEYFFYIVLQAVKDGLVQNISQFPGYNCFYDAARGVARKYKVINWKAYHDAKRSKLKVSLKDYIEVFELQYTRLPGYESLSQEEYYKMLKEKLEVRRAKILEERAAADLGFAGRANLLKTKRGELPQTTKTSTSTSHRPRILSVCPVRRAEYKDWYFSIYYAYKESSESYRSGNHMVLFPEGTYRPYFPYQKYHQVVALGST